jgi:hypothetical protein
VQSSIELDSKVFQSYAKEMVAKDSRMFISGAERPNRGFKQLAAMIYLSNNDEILENNPYTQRPENVAPCINKMPPSINALSVASDQPSGLLTAGIIQNLRNPWLTELRIGRFALADEAALHAIPGQASFRNLRSLTISLPLSYRETQADETVFMPFTQEDATLLGSSPYLHNLDTLEIDMPIQPQALRILLEGAALIHAVIRLPGLESQLQGEQQHAFRSNLLQSLLQHNQDAAAAQGMVYTAPEWLNRAIQQSIEAEAVPMYFTGIIPPD